jgi:hypothetical protein
MAELTMTDTADPCCATETQATCCEPSAKADCCGRQAAPASVRVRKPIECAA